MTEKEIFDLKLSEAKDQLMHIDASIKETRTKVFVLIGICFAMSSYLSEDILMGNIYTIKTFVFLPVFIGTAFVLISSLKAITPSKQRINGIAPSSPIFNNEHLDIEVLQLYEDSIATNGEILGQQTSAYKKSFVCLVIVAILIPFFCLFGILLFETFIGCAS